MKSRMSTIRGRLILSYILLILFSVVLLNMVQLYQGFRYSQKQQLNELEKEMAQAENSITAVFSQLNVIRSQSIEVLINSRAGSGADKKTYLEQTRVIEDGFRALRRAGNYIADINWVDTEGRIFSTNGSIRRENFCENPCLKTLIGSDENLVYSGIYDRSPYLITSDRETVFSVAQNIFDIYHPSHKIGYLEIDLLSGVVEETINMVTKGNDFFYAVLRDENGEVIYGSSLPEKTPSLKKTSEVENGWVLEIGSINTVDKSLLLDNLSGYAAVGAVVLLLSVICAYFSAQSISKPLDRLTAGMSWMRENNKFDRIEAAGNLREIRTLEETYNTLVSSLEFMIQKNVEIQNVTNKAKLLALQTQINPHFLANSFDTIRTLAIRSGSLEVERAVESLAMMFRYVLNDKTHLVHLEDEINYVKSYIRMQEFRFGKQVQVFYRIPQSLLSIRILCLTIQPLVENVYCHALNDDQKTKILIIEAVPEQETIRVSVSDNGCGMDPEQLQAVRKALTVDAGKERSQTDDTEDVFPKTEAQQDDNQEESPEIGIGLINVNSRLMLYYGKDAVLQIQSELNKGTTVSFRIEKVV